jgi:hypothetical protein
MTGLLIFVSGVFISLLTVAGFLVSIWEFKHMGKHPEEYPKDFSSLREGGK